MRVIIVFTTINNLKYNKLCLKSIKCSYPHEIVVMDNGSTDGTVEWLKTQNVTLLENGVNMGMVYAFNSFYDYAWKDEDPDNLLVYFSNDVVVAENTIDDLVKTALMTGFNSYNGYRHTGSPPHCIKFPEDRRFFVGGNKIPVGEGAKRSPGPYYNLIEETADEFVSTMLSKQEEAEFSISDLWSYWHSDSAKLFKKKCFDVVGYWDANYYPGYGMDTDHCWRALRLDDRVGLVPSAFSFSFWSRTAYESGVYPGNVRRKDYAIAKWGLGATLSSKDPRAPANPIYDLPFKGRFPAKYRGYDTSQLKIASRDGELKRIHSLIELAPAPQESWAKRLRSRYKKLGLA